MSELELECSTTDIANKQVRPKTVDLAVKTKISLVQTEYIAKYEV